MKYDLTSELDRQRFIARARKLLEKGGFVELRECTARTLSQNAYLHLLLGVVALDTGNDLQYVKTWYFKKIVNPDLFVVKKQDRLIGEVEVLRSTATLTKEETSVAIDRFKRWGNENGFYMPEPGDESLLREIEIEMGRQQQYL